MNLASNKSALAALTRELMAQWDRAGDAWHDRKREEFQSMHMDKLEAALNRTVTAIDELDKVLTKIRRDCG